MKTGVITIIKELSYSARYPQYLVQKHFVEKMLSRPQF